MKCFHCSQEIDSNDLYCPACGAPQGAGATMVLDQVYNPYAQEPESGRTEPLPPEEFASPYGQQYAEPAAAPAYSANTPAQGYAVPNAAPVYPANNVNQGYAANVYAQPARPVIQLPTGRGMLKMIFLGLITLGIYDMVIYCKMVTELNIVASRYDGKRTMPYFAASILTPITLGIYSFVWIHKLCNRMGAELTRRGINYKFSAASFWLWAILGSLIIVGPFVFLHKQMKAMNLINAHFNVNG